MHLKIYRPKTPSLRHLVRLNNEILSKKPLLKSKIKGLKNKSGRNSNGKITIRSKGSGHKKNYRSINFNRKNKEICIVLKIEYDPFRSSNIASIYNIFNKTFCYITAPKHLITGDIIKTGENIEPTNGNCLPISKIPIGCLIHNISPKKNSKAQISRSAGTFSQLIEKTSNYGIIKISSGEHRRISLNCFATIGIVSNDFSLLTVSGKAGRSRWLNKRPKVRGVAMNPIDHPHGGGEGKTSGGRTSVTPWGKPTKGGKTSRSTNKLKKLKYI